MRFRLEVCISQIELVITREHLHPLLSYTIPYSATPYSVLLPVYDLPSHTSHTNVHLEHPNCPLRMIKNAKHTFRIQHQAEIAWYLLYQLPDHTGHPLKRMHSGEMSTNLISICALCFSAKSRGLNHHPPLSLKHDSVFI